MANEEHLARLKEGVEAWSQWRAADPDIRPDLSGADFSRAYLSRAFLADADLSGTDFSSAYLGGANLADADLSKANLTGANLTGTLLADADLSSAFLAHAHLANAHLDGAILTRAYLIGANLTGAHIGYTTFGNVDLSMVRGLETVGHAGPSTIGIDTLYLSHGQIPEVFLRGAGVPEDFITYTKSLSLAGRLFDFYSCFISYSSRDQEFADRLHADLQHKGVRCWFAPHDVQGGRKLHEQIAQAIRTHERLLLILSGHSMQSEWVKTEIAQARQREVQEKRQVLFPMRLVSFEAVRDWECFDADTGKDSAREIREYFIPDFSNWKNHDAYQVAFQRLLRDLKADI